MANICIFGDSIVQWVYGEYAPSWADIIKMRFHEANKTDIATFGIGGDTSAWLLVRMEPTLAVAKNCAWGWLRTVVIAIGTNDSQEHLNVLLGNYFNPISQEEFEKNLSELAIVAKKYAERVIFVGLAHADENRARWQDDRLGATVRFSEASLRQYDRVIAEVAKKSEVEYISLIDSIALVDLPDGLHPNTEGHRKIAERVYPTLARL